MKGFLMSILGVAIFIGLIGYATRYFVKKDASTPSVVNKNLAIGHLTINNIRVDIEIAQTDEQRAKGLSFREDLRQYSGMLFDFKGKNVRPIFWMKDMRFPIDIIWIKNGKITKINTNIQPEKGDTLEKNYRLYQTPVVIDYVLEMNAKWCDQNGVSVGDEVNFFLPSSDGKT